MNGMENIKKNDIILIYRTAEDGKSAHYNSVITSLCVIEEYKNKKFRDRKHRKKDVSVFLAGPHIIFSTDQSHFTDTSFYLSILFVFKNGYLRIIPACRRLCR